MDPNFAWSLFPNVLFCFISAAGTTEDEAMISWEDAFDRYSDAKMSKTMNIIQWLNMWGRLCYGSAGISDFPIWVQILPDIFFSVIDRDQDGLLSFDEMKNFYRDLVDIKNPAQLEKVCKEGYRAMTAVSILLKCYFFLPKYDLII